MTGIAHQYALAVFSLANEANKVEEFKISLSRFAKSMDVENYKFFAHPKIDKKDKIAIIENTIKDTLLMNFVKVLIDNDRVSLLDSIIIAYQEILNEIHKVMQVQVYSNKPLTKQNLEKIKTKLNKAYNRTIEIKEMVDETILGGYRIEFEGNVIDETINKQIDNLKSSLLE